MPYRSIAMNRMLLFALIVFSSFSLSAQDQHPPGTYQAFVKIYMEQKESGEKPPDRIVSLLEKHTIDRALYASLLKGDSTSVGFRNEDKIKNLHRDILKEKERLAQAREQSTRKACIDSQLPYEVYREMLHRYETGIAFQRSLKPYFDDYFKSLK